MRPLAWSRTDSPSPNDDVRQFLSEIDEQEILRIITKNYRHEQHITSDDVRFVVRSVASKGGAVNLPPDFPPVRWILNFKRAHGFSHLTNTLLPESPKYLGLRRLSANYVSSGGSSDDERTQFGNQHAAAPDSSANALTSLRLAHMRRQQQQQQQHRRQMVIDDHRASNLPQQCENAGETEEFGSFTSSGSENGATTGASGSLSGSSGIAPSSTPESNNVTEPSQGSAPTQNEKRSYKLSHTVPAETWEKAIAAVEQQGMSLRAAAKIYNVHFAALHRRVKKRAQGGQSHKGNNSYFHPSDEAGIVRVVVAHAELGVIMTFDELMKLVESAALRKLPNLSVDDARKLMVHFQSRNEQSIRHIIDDWPPTLPAVSSGGSVANNYYLEHPGYDHGVKASTVTQRSLAARAAEKTNDPTNISTRFGSFFRSTVPAITSYQA